jgi:hypothetical protein
MTQRIIDLTASRRACDFAAFDALAELALAICIAAWHPEKMKKVPMMKFRRNITRVVRRIIELSPPPGDERILIAAMSNQNTNIAMAPKQRLSITRSRLVGILTEIMRRHSSASSNVAQEEKGLWIL